MTLECCFVTHQVKTYPVLAGKVKVPEDLLVQIETLLVHCMAGQL
jgi:hypothetical protein